MSLKLSLAAALVGLAHRLAPGIAPEGFKLAPESHRVIGPEFKAAYFGQRVQIARSQDVTHTYFDPDCTIESYGAPRPLGSPARQIAYNNFDGPGGHLMLNALLS